ncbi:Peptidoglycan O-acetyltransferase [bioreactor metagenome]|uniref:Peptidoglycan O-acetyltransferase n=1 Tax=bioreactor metagenome TaxID=1076179 RepID=A0A645G182_9ZZZZ
MAIGLGKMFGFHFLENFNYPFISKSISEFWRRWHISLGTWFRDYVYIPMGGSRVGTWKWLRNALVVWLLTGMWHGADWPFIVWGLFIAAFVIAEKLFLLKLLEKLPSFLSRVYFLLVLLVSMVIFNGKGIEGSFSDLKSFVGASGIPFTNPDTNYYLLSNAVLLTTAVIASTPLLKTILGKLKSSDKGQKITNAAEITVCFLLLTAAVAYLIDGSFNPFLYFRF